jgi:hypothetical protein
MDRGVNGLEHYDHSHYVALAKDKEPDIQKFFINEFLGLQLCAAMDSSYEQRMALSVDQTVANWLSVLNMVVAPFMASQGLLVDLTDRMPE